jgi:hypothetical protein
VLKVDSDGKIKLKGEHWLISRALSGERIRLVTIQHRVLVYYCQSLVPDESSQPKLYRMSRDVL